MSDEALVQQVDSDLRKILLRPDAPRPQVLGVRVWKQAIPQYNK
jgi:protoporphyrinogen/coproporphyrinogen III oxidase